MKKLIVVLLDFYHLSFGFKSLLKLQNKELNKLKNHLMINRSFLDENLFLNAKKELLTRLSRNQEGLEQYSSKYPLRYKLFKKRVLILIDNVDSHIREVIDYKGVDNIGKEK